MFIVKERFLKFCACEIGNFQKETFWGQKFYLVPCVLGES